VSSPSTPSRRQRADGPATAVAFETAYQELREVIDRLERGGLSLDDAVALFERGRGLAEVCEAAVANAELRVTRLSPESATLLSDLAPDA
jgi:exodeoxyribonuclease VII small subunit